MSSLHASIRWGPGGWRVRDLASRNGTTLDGTLLTTGDWRALSAGSELSFGHPQASWRLLDDTAPAAIATTDEGKVTQRAEGGILMLPSRSDPQILIYRDQTGAWVSEDDEGVRPLLASTSIQCDGRSWQLDLPERDARTPLWVVSGIGDVQLKFRVSTDEEYVELGVVVDGRLHDLGSRSHHYLLLTLARLRQRDQAQAPTKVQDHGWVQMATLVRMMRLDERPLNLQIFRIRKQFAELGLRDAPRIVERRRGTGQLRLNVSQFSIDRLA